MFEFSISRMKKPPSGRFLRENGAAILHHCVTSFLSHEKHVQRGKSHEDVDEPLHHGPCTEKHVHEIPIAAQEAAYTNEKPVKASDDEEPPSDHVQFHMH